MAEGHRELALFEKKEEGEIIWRGAGWVGGERAREGGGGVGCRVKRREGRSGGERGKGEWSRWRRWIGRGEGNITQVQCKESSCVQMR